METLVRYISGKGRLRHVLLGSEASTLSIHIQMANEVNAALRIELAIAVGMMMQRVSFPPSTLSKCRLRILSFKLGFSQLS